MEQFLAALPESLRSAVERSLDHPDGREILRQEVRPYYDQGQWPSSRWTAEMVALAHLRRVKAVAEPALASQIEKLLANREAFSSGSGALAPVLAGAGSAAAAGAGAAGLKMFTDKQLQKQWASHIDLADVLRGDIKGAVAKVIRGVTSQANWDLLGKMATSAGFDPETWESEVGQRLGDGLMSNLAGILGRAAWSGQRDALDSLPEGTRLSDFQSATDEWVKEYTTRLVQGQKALSERTARESIHRYLENGLPQDTITRRLMQVFPLSPRQSMAVDNYRRGLVKQDKPRGMIARFSNRYAKQLLDQKEDMIARTEANASLNFGRQIMFEKAVQNGTLPTDTRKQWITAGDEWVCPHCRPMDEEDAPLNTGFDTSLGSIYVPPAHPRCRCVIVPVAQSLAKRVEKHLGGASGLEDHPSGTPQTVHAGGEKGKAARLAVLMNKTEGSGTLSIEELEDQFGAEYLNRIQRGVTEWQGSFKAIKRLRGLLDGSIEPGEAKNPKFSDDSLLSLQRLVEQAPANSPRLYRGIRIKAEPEQVEKMLREGDTLDPTIASFSSNREIADNYGIRNVWKPFRRGKTGVTFVLDEGSRGVHVEPLGLSVEESLIGSLDEWVVQGSFEITKVEKTNDHHYDVHVKQKSSSLSKADALGVISRFLEYSIRISGQGAP